MSFLLKMSAVLLLMLTLGSAQQADSAKPTNELPTFKAKAELVLVPVVVSDKNGVPDSRILTATDAFGRPRVARRGRAVKSA